MAKKIFYGAHFRSGFPLGGGRIPFVQFDPRQSKKKERCLLIPTLIEIKGKKEAIFQPSLFEWKMHSLPFLLLVFLSALPAPSAQKMFILEKIGKMAQN